MSELVVDVAEVQAFFLEAMSCGWGSDNMLAPAILPSKFGPKMKQFMYEKGIFRLIDTWSGTEGSDYSAGMTMIWQQGEPVWVMQYGGWYAEVAIPFLKLILRSMYTGRRFNGGRGPGSHNDEVFSYCNTVDQNNFANFKGEESIHGPKDRFLGFHRYSGLLLVPQK